MRDVLNLYCPPCDMQSVGGCNAGCCDDCACSVPVSKCTRCGDCDYGQTDERQEVIAACHERNGKPAGAMNDAELIAEVVRTEPTDHSLLPNDERYRREELEKEFNRRGLSMPVAA